MKRIFIFIIGVLFCANYAFAADDSDFQYWNTANVSWKLDEDWKMGFEEELRFVDNGGNLSYTHSDLGLTYSGLAEWLDLGLNYRQIFEKKSGEWKEENQPHINATLKWKFADFSFSNRTRFAYRNKEDADNFWVYRNKFTIKSPWKLTKFAIQPFIADEVFYDFDAKTLNRNRLYAGFSLKLLDNLKGELFYLWQSSEASHKWSDTNVLGTKFSISF
ncbi:DUF2490 domain-containing protein [Candidatus Omnitrophota bacterium]